MKCNSCGAESNLRFCPYCGAEMPIENKVTIINNYYQAPSQKQQQPIVQPTIIYRNTLVDNVSGCNKWVDFFLCFFLGWLGVHKFYEGKIGLGILYIFTFGLFGIGMMIDLIIILCNGAKDKQGRVIK